MTEPLPVLIDTSIEIAWDYLNRTGELGDPIAAGRFLSHTIELMVRRGERRRLMLANNAIAAYQQFRRQQSKPPCLPLPDQLCTCCPPISRSRQPVGLHQRDVAQ